MKLCKYLLMMGLSFCITDIATAKSVKNNTSKKAVDEISSQEKKIQRVITQLKDLRKENSIPAGVLNAAKGVVVLQNYKAGFIFSVAASDGVGMKKLGNQWGPISFYNASSLGAGLQLGAQKGTILMLLMTDKSLNALTDNKLKFGAGIFAVAGPKSASDTTVNNADVFLYTQSKGLDIGAAINGSTLSCDEKDNDAFYGKHLPVEDILNGKEINISSSVKLLHNALEDMKEDVPVEKSTTK